MLLILGMIVLGAAITASVVGAIMFGFYRVHEIQDAKGETIAMIWLTKNNETAIHKFEVHYNDKVYPIARYPATLLQPIESPIR